MKQVGVTLVVVMVVVLSIVELPIQMAEAVTCDPMALYLHVQEPYRHHLHRQVGVARS